MSDLEETHINYCRDIVLKLINNQPVLAEEIINAFDYQIEKTEILIITIMVALAKSRIPDKEIIVFEVAQFLISNHLLFFLKCLIRNFGIFGPIYSDCKIGLLLNAIENSNSDIFNYLYNLDQKFSVEQIDILFNTALNKPDNLIVEKMVQLKSSKKQIKSIFENNISNEKVFLIKNLLKYYPDWISIEEYITKCIECDADQILNVFIEHDMYILSNYQQILNQSILKKSHKCQSLLYEYQVMQNLLPNKRKLILESDIIYDPDNLEELISNHSDPDNLEELISNHSDSDNMEIDDKKFYY
jgi:hypothetical protein